MQLGGGVIGAFHTAYRGLVGELGLTIEPAFPSIPGDDTYSRSSAWWHRSWLKSTLKQNDWCSSYNSTPT